MSAKSIARHLRGLPLAALAAAGVAAPSAAAPTAAELPAERQALQARVESVRAALKQAAASPPENRLRLLAQAATWTNWPKWSKWSNWANK